MRTKGHLTLVHSADTAQLSIREEFALAVNEDLIGRVIIDPPGATTCQQQERGRRLNGLISLVQRSTRDPEAPR